MKCGTLVFIFALFFSLSSPALCEDRQLINAEALQKVSNIDSKLPVLNISVKDHIKSLVPSLRVASYSGSTSDFFKSMEIRGRINNILRPAASIEVVFKW